MVFLNFISIVSLITTVIGLILIGEKRASGFLVFIVSLLCQIFIFYQSNNTFLIVQMIVLIIFDYLNFLKWTKGDNK